MGRTSFTTTRPRGDRLRWLAVSNAEEFGAWIRGSAQLRDHGSLRGAARSALPAHDRRRKTPRPAFARISTGSAPSCRPPRFAEASGTCQRAFSGSPQARAPESRPSTLGQAGSGHLLPHHLHLLPGGLRRYWARRFSPRASTLTTRVEAREIEGYVEGDQVPCARDAVVLGVDSWKRVDARHRCPPCWHAAPHEEEVVEHLFRWAWSRWSTPRKRSRWVSNMPAASSSSNRSPGWNGTAHVSLSAGSLRSCRAGRGAGIDTEEPRHRLASHGVAPQEVAALTSKRTIAESQHSTPT